MTHALRGEPPLVLHVLFRFATGGLENGVVNLLNRLPEECFRHAVLAIDTIDASFTQRVQRSDVIYHALNKPPGHALKLYPRVFRLLRELRPAVVHTRNLAALELQAVAAAARVPVRIHGEHGRDIEDLDGTNRKLQRLRRMYAPLVHRYVTVSEDLRRYLVDRVGVTADRIEQIYNGVDTERFAPPASAPASIDACPFDSGRHWIVGTVGRLQAVKNQGLLVRAFARALELRPPMRADARLVIAGDGPMRGELEALVASTGERDRIWLAGERSDAPALLRGLRLFALPSKAEGISNTILESMATGLPVIATAVGGNVELVQPGRTGECVEPESVEALAQALARAHAEPERLRAQGEEGRRLAVERFSLAAMVDRYAGVYEREIAERART